ncbi:MAG: amidohydrolase [Verrucomicrobiota bacterium]|nr:amidohydrolase [Verrucomicrobiota bacterium]
MACRALPRFGFQPYDALGLMAGAGVDYAVVVHPEPYQDDHRYLDHCLEIGRGKLKGTCLFFAEQPDAARRLRDYAGRHPGQLTAARIHAYNPERLPPFGRPELEALWRTASDLGLAIQLHFEPRYAPGFEPLIREFSKTLVLIDHLGRPLQGTEKEYELIVKWSQLENTVMKLSALPEKREYPHRDIAPFVKRLTAAWGPQRLLYGGGYGETATKESYRGYRERLREYLAHLSATDQADILGGNAARLFGWSEGA